MRVALVPIGFIVGALLSRLWLAYAPRRIAADLAQPLVVVTYWHAFGARMWFALFIAIAIGAVGYLSVLRMVYIAPSTDQASRGTTRGIAPVFWCAIACAAALLFPVVFSSDVYAYAGYGDMAVHGINPYIHAKLTFRDPLMNAMVWQWSDPPPVCVYGPIFVWIAKEIVVLFAAFGPAAPLWALRIIACVALVACAPLASAAFAPLGERAKSIAAVGIALNPMAIWSAAEGHNDGLLLAIALAGFALMRRSGALGGFVLGASALVKVPGLATAFFLGLWTTLESMKGTATRLSVRNIVGGILAGVFVTLVVAVPIVRDLLMHPMTAGNAAAQYSLQSILMPFLGAIAAFCVPLAIVLVAFAIQIKRLARGELNAIQGIALAAWLVIPNPYPWYSLWILPCAFLDWQTPAARAIVALSLTTVLRYFAEGVAILPAPRAAALALLQLAIPAVVYALSYHSKEKSREGPALTEVAQRAR